MEPLILVALPRGRAHIARHMQKKIGKDVLVVTVGSCIAGARLKAAYLPADAGPIELSRYEAWIADVKARFVPGKSTTDNLLFY